ncbi:hypothetical protein [Streptomyces griseochromogenes]|uniref:hypothetical protein n=1 Tax=Streptomyces griseochromogenes TaxID=68214 RepID=UPI0037BCA6C3
MSQTAMDAGRSAECAVARRPEYRGLHVDCLRTKDVPLPHSMGLVLMPRCTWPCHQQSRGGGR